MSLCIQDTLNTNTPKKKFNKKTKICIFLFKEKIKRTYIIGLKHFPPQCPVKTAAPKRVDSLELHITHL